LRKIIYMKLLILTQKIDRNDDLLGFFHGWVAEFAKYYEKITVIALGVGEYDLPGNVRVLSLGKEKNSISPHSCHSRESGNPGLGSLVKPGMTNRVFIKIRYISNFYRYVWRERKNYDSVFVHMNQEYVILGGLAWRTLGKKILLWRNHKADGFWARLAVVFSHVVFCTSQFAFVARYKKTKLMPVGVDTDFFKPDRRIIRMPGSMLFFGRISPVKRPDRLIAALNILKKEGADFTARIVGDAPVRDKLYLENVKQMVKDYGLEDRVEFVKGVPYWQAPTIYAQSEIFINLTPSGSLDKTIFEAMACGCLVLMSNESLAGELDKRLFFSDNDPVNLAGVIKNAMSLDEAGKQQIIVSSRQFVVKKHSLAVLADRLKEIL